MRYKMGLVMDGVIRALCGVSAEGNRRNYGT